jgi:hypothetical protein
MARRRLKGDRSFKRLLKQMVPAIREECEKRLEEFGKEMASVQRQSGRFVNRSGSLRTSISYQVLRQSLKVKIGIIGKALNKKLFYGRIIEFGRKGGGRGIKRKSPKYMAGVGRTRPEQFIYGHSDQHESFKSSFNNYWDRVLSRASRGTGDE